MTAAKAAKVKTPRLPAKDRPLTLDLTRKTLDKGLGYIEVKDCDGLVLFHVMPDEGGFYDHERRITYTVVDPDLRPDVLAAARRIIAKMYANVSFGATITPGDIRTHEEHATVMWSLALDYARAALDVK